MNGMDLGIGRRLEGELCPECHAVLKTKTDELAREYGIVGDTPAVALTKVQMTSLSIKMTRIVMNEVCIQCRIKLLVASRGSKI